MLTSIRAKDKNNIKKFIQIQSRGPFKYLNDKSCSDPQSEYIVEKSSKYENIYQCAVAQAWLDACRHVEIKNNRRKLEETRIKISESLRIYFAGKAKNKDAFDNWYDSLLCSTTTNTPLNVGQAQKLINMSFKYLMCCEDIRQNKLAHFTWCHMPLDSVTLDWIGLHGLIWNRLDDNMLYFCIQDYVRFKAHNDNVLLKEFEVWSPIAK